MIILTRLHQLRLTVTLWHELCAEDVRGVPRIDAIQQPSRAVVPHVHARVVRAGDQQGAGLVPCDGVHTARVPLQTSGVKRLIFTSHSETRILVSLNSVNLTDLWYSNFFPRFRGILILWILPPLILQRVVCIPSLKVEQQSVSAGWPSFRVKHCRERRAFSAAKPLKMDLKTWSQRCRTDLTKVFTLLIWTMSLGSTEFRTAKTVFDFNTSWSKLGLLSSATRMLVHHPDRNSRHTNNGKNRLSNSKTKRA